MGKVEVVSWSIGNNGTGRYGQPIRSGGTDGHSGRAMRTRTSHDRACSPLIRDSRTLGRTPESVPARRC